MPWSSAHLSPLLRGAPPPGRALGEVAFVFMVVLGGDLVAAPQVATGLRLGVFFALAIWGVSLLRQAGGATAEGGRAGVGASTLFLLALTAALFAAPAAAMPPEVFASFAAESAPTGAVDPAAGAGRRLFAHLTVRNLAMIGLVALLLRANRQHAAHLGLLRAAPGRQVLQGAGLLAVGLAVHFLLAVVLSGLLRAAGIAEDEAERRLDALRALTADIELLEFAGAMVVVACFEEIVFRGFALPRLRQAAGGWGFALLLTSIVFGLGHLYEGALGALQAAALGVYFGLAFLWKGRLLPVIVAHAGFNVIMYVLFAAVEATPG